MKLSKDDSYTQTRDRKPKDKTRYTHHDKTKPVKMTVQEWEAYQQGCNVPGFVDDVSKAIRKKKKHIILRKKKQKAIKNGNEN